jgi:hypothetical protein
MMSGTADRQKTPSPLGERQGTREAGRVRGRRRARVVADRSRQLMYPLTLPSPRRGEGSLLGGRS